MELPIVAVLLAYASSCLASDCALVNNGYIGVVIALADSVPQSEELISNLKVSSVIGQMK